MKVRLILPALLAAGVFCLASATDAQAFELLNRFMSRSNLGGGYATQKGATQKGHVQKGACQKGAAQKGACQKGAHQKGAHQKGHVAQKGRACQKGDCGPAQKGGFGLGRHRLHRRGAAQKGCCAAPRPHRRPHFFARHGAAQKGAPAQKCAPAQKAAPAQKCPPAQKGGCTQKGGHRAVQKGACQK